jgi:hypothetical protein
MAAPRGSPLRMSRNVSKDNVENLQPAEDQRLAGMLGGFGGLRYATR